MARLFGSFGVFGALFGPHGVPRKDLQHLPRKPLNMKDGGALASAHDHCSCIFELAPVLADEVAGMGQGGQNYAPHATFHELVHSDVMIKQVHFHILGKGHRQVQAKDAQFRYQLPSLTLSFICPTLSSTTYAIAF
jgi:hypothetical protein